MATLALIAALPREIAGLVRGAAVDRSLLPRGIHLYRIPGALVVCAGMGGLRATLAVEAALGREPTATLVSVGLAGGCDPSTEVGSVVVPRMVVDALSGVRYESSDIRAAGILATAAGIASVQEKARLYAAYGAAVVDMEAATVARLAGLHGLEFRAIKAVSDGHDFELSSLARFSDTHGGFRTGAFALHTSVRPHRWRGTVRLGVGSNRALRALQTAIEDGLAREQG